MQNPDTHQPDQEDGPIVAPILRMIIGRRWVILLTAVVITLAAIAILLVLPNRYQSEATLLIVNQQVPERYVAPTTTTNVNDALQALSKEVLSRRRLLAVIDEHGLYAAKRKKLAPEQIVEMMSKDIFLEPLDPSKTGRNIGDFNAFKIAYTGEDPIVVQKVTSTLTSLFIQENLRTREEQATTTTTFLGEQVALKKQQLDAQEQRLREFKMQALGELPEQQPGNLAILTGLQMQLQNTMGKIGAAQQQRVYIETLLGAHLPASSAQAQSGNAPVVISNTGSPLSESLAADIVKLRTHRDVLLGQYTDRHPDVLKLDREIALREAALETVKNGEAKIAASASTSSAATAASRPVARGTMGEPAAVAQLQSQLEANRVEMKNLTTDEANLKTAIELYQQRINNTPVREQELAGIIRETESLRLEYADLQKKQQESLLARELEKNQRGQQFRLVDAPSFPTVPVSPKRLKLSAVAAGAGIALGLMLAFALEFRLRSFHTEEELRNHLKPAVPIIVAMPVLLTNREQQRLKWKTAGEWCAATVLITLVGLAELYVFRFG
jgi:polysaccharide biosynthesis transport protein